MSGPAPARPGDICRELLAALEASEGRRQRRKRDTTPDAIGLTMKRELLERAVAADPKPDEFEAWLLEQCRTAGGAEGGVRAMALSRRVRRPTTHPGRSGSPTPIGSEASPCAD